MREQQANFQQATESINLLIQSFDDRSQFSDGYHTFGELHDHRNALWLAICNIIEATSYLKDRFGINEVWKSWFHSDGSAYDGWFLLGMQTKKGQVTYHLPGYMYSDAKVPELKQAPDYDGHTSADVVKRIVGLF